jgi:DNA-3-methyladenine glycosylase II
MADLVDSFRVATKALTKADPILARLIRTVGPCTLTPDPNGFQVLVRSVVSQLISTKAAVTIGARLQALCGEKGLVPEAILEHTEAELRGVGLSGAKTLSIRTLATEILEGRLDLAALSQSDDVAVDRTLVALPGIGPWTAEMYRIFCLGRLDVLPVADLGLRAAVQEHFGLDAMPDKRTLLARGEPWRPYRTVATWYLWRSRGAVPQSETKSKRAAK